MTNGYFDLAKPADYRRFADLHGERVAKALRFALVYGVKYTGSPLKDVLKGTDLVKADFAKLEAAFASQVRK